MAAAAKTKHDQELQQTLSLANWKKAVQLCDQYEIDVCSLVKKSLLIFVLVSNRCKQSNSP
jgi:hypothetical protein